MKQTPDMDAAQRRMRAGVITRDGFLGADARKLIDILVEDEAEVGRLGVTHGAIASRMQALHLAGRRGLGLPIRVEPHFEVQVDSARGKLPCPFTHRGLYPKTWIAVANLKTGESTTYSELNIHLIGEHGFYEGRGASFRVAPGDLVRILDVRADGGARD